MYSWSNRSWCVCADDIKPQSLQVTKIFTPLNFYISKLRMSYTCFFCLYTEEITELISQTKHLSLHLLQWNTIAIMLSYWVGNIFNKPSSNLRKNSWVSCCSPRTMLENSVRYDNLFVTIIAITMTCVYYNNYNTLQVVHQRCWINHWWLEAVLVLIVQSPDRFKTTPFITFWIWDWAMSNY